MIQFGLTVLDAQSDMLSFVGQEAIAHAAGIFATLTAAFAFATGFKEKIRQEQDRTVFILCLSFLLALTVYLAIRMYSYGALSATVATLPPRSDNLTGYWNNVTLATVDGNIIVHYGITGIFSSIVLSWLLGYEFAVCITSYLIEGCQESFEKTLIRPVFLPARWREEWCTFALIFFILNTCLTYALFPWLGIGGWAVSFLKFAVADATLIAIIISAVAAVVAHKKRVRLKRIYFRFLKTLYPSTSQT